MELKVVMAGSVDEGETQYSLVTIKLLEFVGPLSLPELFFWQLIAINNGEIRMTLKDRIRKGFIFFVC